MNRKITLLLMLIFFSTSISNAQDAAVLVPYLTNLVMNANATKGLYQKSLKLQQDIQRMAENAKWIKNIQTTKDIVRQTDNVVCMIKEYHLLEALRANIVGEEGLSGCIYDASNEILLIKANWVFDQTELIVSKLAMDPADRQTALNDIVKNLDELITEILYRTNILKDEVNQVTLDKVAEIIMPPIRMPEFEPGAELSSIHSSSIHEVYNQPKYEYGIDTAKLNKGKSAIIKIADKAINIILLMYAISAAWSIMRGKEIGQVLINLMLAIVVWDIIKIVLG